MLKPGTYKLSRDVVNPRADRRQKYDWRALPSWGKNAQFFVEERDYGEAELRVEHNLPLTFTVIRLVGEGWAHQVIGPNDREEQYKLLEEALEQIEETLDAMFTRLDVKGHFTKWLVRRGKLSREQFEAFWHEYMNEPESEED